MWLLRNVHSSVADVRELRKAARFLDLLMQDWEIVGGDLGSHGAMRLLLLALAHWKRRRVDEEVCVLLLFKRDSRDNVSCPQKVIISSSCRFHRFMCHRNWKLCWLLNVIQAVMMVSQVVVSRTEGVLRACQSRLEHPWLVLVPLSVLHMRWGDYHVLLILYGVALHHVWLLLDKRALPACQVIVVTHSLN